MTDTVEVLLSVFNHEAKQARVVLEVAKNADSKFTPMEGMRSLLEVANHLAQIPSLDYRMYLKEIDSTESAQSWEKKLNRESIDEILVVFDKGIKDVNEFFKGMNDKEFLEKKLKPFYEQGDQKGWDFYMPEFITHIAMHKMQLWMYLKLAGMDVNMMTYYGYAPSE